MLNSQTGKSFIELIACLGILGCLGVAGILSANTLMQETRVRKLSQQLHQGLKSVRSLSLSQQQDLVFCLSQDRIHCHQGPRAEAEHPFWIAFADLNTNYRLDAPEESLILTQAWHLQDAIITSNSNRIAARFQKNGFAKSSAMRYSICSERSSDIVQVVLARVGSSRVESVQKNTTLWNRYCD